MKNSAVARSMLYLDVLHLDYVIEDIGLNDQMNSKKQELLKSDLINDKYIE